MELLKCSDLSVNMVKISFMLSTILNINWSRREMGETPPPSVKYSSCNVRTIKNPPTNVCPGPDEQPLEKKKTSTALHHEDNFKMPNLALNRGRISPTTVLLFPCSDLIQPTVNYHTLLVIRGDKAPVHPTMLKACISSIRGM